MDQILIFFIGVMVFLISTGGTVAGLVFERTQRSAVADRVHRDRAGAGEPVAPVTPLRPRAVPTEKAA